MIRKLLTVTMVLTALGLAIAGGASFSRPLVQTCRVSSKHWLAALVFDGRARLFWITSKDERILDVRRDPNAARIQVTTTYCPAKFEAYSKLVIQTIKQDINIGSRNQVPPFGGDWQRPLGSYDDRAWQALASYTFVRAPVGLLVAALLITPAIAYIRGPMRLRQRQRRGLCSICGYNLTGLTEPRCPECGARVNLISNSVEQSTVHRCESKKN